MNEHLVCCHLNFPNNFFHFSFLLFGKFFTSNLTSSLKNDIFWTSEVIPSQPLRSDRNTIQLPIDLSTHSLIKNLPSSCIIIIEMKTVIFMIWVNDSYSTWSVRMKKYLRFYSTCYTWFSRFCVNIKDVLEVLTLLNISVLCYFVSIKINLLDTRNELRLLFLISPFLRGFTNLALFQCINSKKTPMFIMFATLNAEW